MRVEIRYVREADRDFWFRLDAHLSAEEFEKKLRDRQGYVIFSCGVPKGILRWNLFWDNTPFLNMIFLLPGFRRRGLGRAMLEFWTSEMAAQGSTRLLTSTLSNEEA